MLKLFLVDQPDSAKRVHQTILRLWEKKPQGLAQTGGPPVCSLPPLPFGAGESLDAIFASWMRRALEEPCGPEDTILFLIHANAQVTAGTWLQECEGTEFLKHLRLTSLPQDASHQMKTYWKRIRSAHAIVYSFESLENILRRKPGDLILMTTGVTFMRMPESFRQAASEGLSEEQRLVWKAPLSPEILQAKAVIGADIRSDSFRAAIRADYVPPDDAHRFANWWGVKRMIEDARKLPSPTGAGVSQITVPGPVEGMLKQLSNKKTIFLSSHALKATGRTPSEPEEGAIRELREALKDDGDKPVIVYVDDQMKNGWYEAVHYTLSGRAGSYENPSTWLKRVDGSEDGFHFPPSWDDCGELATAIVGLKPRLVITDLRLAGEIEGRQSFKGSSGAQLISALRAAAPALPILLMTASNRADSVQQAEQVGADAYWTKEGIGERSSPHTKFHTVEFVLLVKRLLGDDYRLLRALDRSVQRATESVPAQLRATCTFPSIQVRQVSELWWLSHMWVITNVADANVRTALTNTRVDLEDAIDHLRSIVRIYREYLRQTRGFASPNDMTAQMWRRSICLQIGVFVEFIHCFPALSLLPLSVPAYESSGTIAPRRGDWLGKALYEIRNDASHYNSEQFTDESLFLTVLALQYWLRVCCPRGGQPMRNGLYKAIRSGDQAAFFRESMGYHVCIPKDREKLLDL